MSDGLHALLERSMSSRRVRRLLTPLARAYIRYMPIRAGKRGFWDAFVEPYLAWRSYSFVGSTVFGARMAGEASDLMQQWIYYFGIWEPGLTHWVSARLQPGDVFVDVGANIGYYSLLASKLVGDAGGVVAVEASSATFGLLRENVRRNGARNVRLVNAAAAEFPGTVKVFRGQRYNAGEATVVEGDGLEVEAEVVAAPLSALLTVEEVRRARLIKIDVEGAEWAVVAGLAGILDTCRPDLDLVVEIHPEQLAAHSEKTPDAVLELLADHGFEACTIADDAWPHTYIKGERQDAVPLRERLEEEAIVVLSRRPVGARRQVRV